MRVGKYLRAFNAWKAVAASGRAATARPVDK